LEHIKFAKENSQPTAWTENLYVKQRMWKISVNVLKEKASEGLGYHV
jgi:hypothetical protein